MHLNFFTGLNKTTICWIEKYTARIKFSYQQAFLLLLLCSWACFGGSTLTNLKLKLKGNEGRSENYLPAALLGLNQRQSFYFTCSWRGFQMTVKKPTPKYITLENK